MFSWFYLLYHKINWLPYLLRFNGIVSWLVYEMFNMEPKFIGSTSARKQAGIKVPRGQKAKQVVLQYQLESCGVLLSTSLQLLQYFWISRCAKSANSDCQKSTALTNMKLITVTAPWTQLSWKVSYIFVVCSIQLPSQKNHKKALCNNIIDLIVI